MFTITTAAFYSNLDTINAISAQLVDISSPASALCYAALIVAAWATWRC